MKAGLLLVVAVLALGGCGGDTPDAPVTAPAATTAAPEPTPTPTPTPSESTAGETLEQELAPGALARVCTRVVIALSAADRDDPNYQEYYGKAADELAGSSQPELAATGVLMDPTEPDRDLLELAQAHCEALGETG